MTKTIKFTNVLVLLVIFSVMILAALFFPSAEFVLTENPINSFNNGWYYNGEVVTPKDQLELKKSEAYALKNTIPSSVEKNDFLLIRSSLSDVSVQIDDSIIFSHKIHDDQRFSKPMASLWHLVKLPHNSAEEEIVITYQSPYAKMNGLINEVYYGEKGSLLFYIIHRYGRHFLLDLIVILLGILMVLVSFINPEKLFNNMFCVGMFSLIAGLWLIAESKMLQFFTGSQIIHGSLAYVSLAFLPIPLLYYIKNVLSEDSKPILKKMIVISWLIAAIVISFQLFNIRDFFETIGLTHGSYLVYIIIILKQLYYEVTIKKNKLAKYFLMSIGVLFIFVFIEVIRFALGTVFDVTLFIRVGLLLFIFLLSIGVGRQLFYLLKDSYKAEFYKKLAFLDQLTHGPNRMDFERDLERIFKTKHKLEDLRLVILDINDLKKINDTYGHTIGDQAIKEAYTLISTSFNRCGKTYRIGGDEFACIVLNKEDSIYEVAKKDLFYKVRKRQKDLDYPLSIAVGSVVHDGLQDDTAEKMIHRADIQMYAEKDRYKKTAKYIQSI